MKKESTVRNNPWRSMLLGLSCATLFLTGVACSRTTTIEQVQEPVQAEAETPTPRYKIVVDTPACVDDQHGEKCDTQPPFSPDLIYNLPWDDNSFA